MEVEIVFLTPAFIGGADCSKAEFRLPSLKGFMRYWFRTLLRKAGWNWKDIKVFEAKVFGDTTRASSFSIRLLDRSIDRRNALGTLSSTVVYIAGMGLARGNSWQREAIPSSSSFKLRFSLRPKARTEYLTLGLLSLFIGSHFQGLGSRSRKGFGAFEVKAEGLPSSLDEAFDLFYDLLKEVISSDENFKGIALRTREEFLEDLKGSYKVRKGYNLPSNWRDALSFLGRKYREFRKQGADNNRHTRDFDHVILPLLNGERVIEAIGPSFGLPINYRSRSLNLTVSFKPKVFGRRASPIFFTFSRDSLYISYWVDDRLEYLPRGKQELSLSGRGVRNPSSYVHDVELVRRHFESFYRFLLSK